MKPQLLGISTLLLGVTTVTLLAPPARADIALSLREAVTRAKAASPELRGLRDQARSAEAKASLQLAPYEPTLTLGFNDLPHAFEIGNAASQTLVIQEQLGFPGRAFANRSAAKHQARALEAQLNATELQIAGNAKSAYEQLALTQANLTLNREQRESYQRILEITKRRYAAGAIPQVDLLNAQVTLYQNDNDLSDLEAAESVARASLNVLLGQPPETVLTVEPLKVATFPLPAESEAESRMLEHRHELRAAREQLEAADDQVRVAKMGLLPDFFVSAGMTQYNVSQASPWVSAGVANAPTYTYMASVQMMIPIFGLFNEREAIHGASADRANADANLQIALNQSRVLLKTTLANLKSLSTRLKTSEEHLLPLSEQALSLALINYSAGKIDFQTLVDTANSRRNIRRDEWSAWVSYLTNYATLGQLMGEEL